MDFKIHLLDFKIHRTKPNPAAVTALLTTYPLHTSNLYPLRELVVAHFDMFDCKTLSLGKIGI
jgi:hypothetical protein